MSPTLLRGQHDRIGVGSGPRPGIPSQMRMLEVRSKIQAGPGIVAGKEALGLAMEELHELISFRCRGYICK